MGIDRRSTSSIGEAKRGNGMSRPNEKMKLGMFVRPCGHHIASWRHEKAQADAGINFKHFVQMAQTAERGLFDFLFSADSATAWTTDEAGLNRSHYVAWIEPFPLLTALAGFTSKIGLVCTGSTSFEEPYALARRFASLDLISGGRAGWNVVTTANPAVAENFGPEPHLPKLERYRRAHEFVDVVKGLWDSWDEDAFVRDRKAGVFFDWNRMHVLNHHGKYYHARGPLNVARSPQGQPVIVQAGASEDGKELAAETAEVVFTAHETIGGAKAFYEDLKERLGKYGREPQDVKILPGISVTVAPTRQEAQDKFQQLQDLIHPEVGVALLGRRMGFDFSGYPVDGPVPEMPMDAVLSSRVEQMNILARSENLTIRQLYQRFAASRGHFSVVGTPKQVADQMTEWFEDGAADGFNVMAPYLPGGLDDFVELVVPEMQRRGLFKTQYEGATLRDHLGLKRPESRYTSREAEMGAV